MYECLTRAYACSLLAHPHSKFQTAQYAHVRRSHANLNVTYVRVRTYKRMCTQEIQRYVRKNVCITSENASTNVCTIVSPSLRMHFREREPRWGEGVRTYVSSAYACTPNYAVRTCILMSILGRVSVHFFCVVRYICRGTQVRTYV